MSIAKITPAFIAAKKQFSPALKQRENSHFKNKYADLAACIEAVNEALLENGIAMYQETFDDPNGVTIETVFLHESTEMIRSGKLHVPASKQDAQGYGSALTYARRYSLMAACGIAGEDDDGNAATKVPPPAVKATPVSAKPITRDTFDKMDAETQEWLRNHAMHAIAFMAKGNFVEAQAYLHDLELDADLRTAMFSLFDSKQRTGLSNLIPTRKAA